MLNTKNKTNTPIKDKFVKLGYDIIYENQVKKMSLDEIEFLVSKINQEIMNVSKAKREISNLYKLTGIADPKYTKLKTKLYKLSDSLEWISIIRKNKKSKEYNKTYLSEEFMKAAELLLNKDTYTHILELAKTSI